MLASVDDKRHYVNYLPNQSNKNILTAIEITVSSWNELLHFVGGALKSSKYAWYLVNWDFDSNGSPFMESTQEELKLLCMMKLKYNQPNFNPTKPPPI